MRYVLMAGCVVALSPAALNADSTFLNFKLPSLVKNVAEGAEAGDAGQALSFELSTLALDAANSRLNLLEESILSTTGFKYLELSVGSDVFGLDGGSKTKTEAMAVYGLFENQNTYVFSQGSLVNFDDLNTVNVGLGVRNINDADTVIMGANAFYDYEAQSGHKRSSIGVELLTSMFEVRANSYNAITGTVNYKGIDETALDGNDFKLTANLPYFYSSDIYATVSNWKDGQGYKVENDEFGLNAEIMPNVVLNIASQKRRNQPVDTVASVSYSIPLGGAASTEKKVMQDGTWSGKFESIRDQLYQPVERENRIMKKAIKLGVTVSGY